MNVIEKPLDKVKQRKLQEMLASDDFKTLIALLESQVLKHEAEATNLLAKQTEPGDSVAKESLDSAASIRRFMALVHQFEKSENLNLVTVLPDSLK